jgi:hypothetical protein
LATLRLAKPFVELVKISSLRLPMVLPLAEEIGGSLSVVK